MATILLIDDDPAFVREAEKMLVEAGYEVLQAPDGVHAVRMLDQLHGRVDLAIVDLALPGINGFELIGALSRRPSPVKVIATTGLYNDAQLESAAALGAHAALRKPRVAGAIPRQQWLNTIEQLIGKPRAHSAP